MGKKKEKPELVEVLEGGLTKSQADGKLNHYAQALTRQGRGSAYYVILAKSWGSWRVELWRRV